MIVSILSYFGNLPQAIKIRYNVVQNELNYPLILGACQNWGQGGTKPNRLKPAPVQIANDAGNSKITHGDPTGLPNSDPFLILFVEARTGLPEHL